MGTRRDYWLTVGLAVLVVLLYLALPRYTWQHADGPYYLRQDRWTGRAELRKVPVVHP